MDGSSVEDCRSLMDCSGSGVAGLEGSGVFRPNSVRRYVNEVGVAGVFGVCGTPVKPLMDILRVGFGVLVGAVVYCRGVADIARSADSLNFLCGGSSLSVLVFDGFRNSLAVCWRRNAGFAQMAAAEPRGLEAGDRTEVGEVVDGEPAVSALGDGVVAPLAPALCCDGRRRGEKRADATAKRHVSTYTTGMYECD